MMIISEKKMQIVMNNYFKAECDINTSIREAFEKGFRIGVQKGYETAKILMESAKPERTAKVKESWGLAICCACKKRVILYDNYCSHCGARLEWNE